MQITLISSTPNPDHVVYAAARQCYSTDTAANFVHDPDPMLVSNLLKKVLSMGHESVLEHASFTFAIEGISRACSHQLVRFRIASFSQQSQRYCTVKEQFPYVTPDSITEKYEPEFHAAMRYLAELYESMIKRGVPAEDARFVLPNACCTNIVMTMNARELLHAFRLRCCTHAQWEIRDLFQRILSICKKSAPLIFANAGPTCVTEGICREGSRSCGRIK